jgi:iodotyrosine deiodinase
MANPTYIPLSQYRELPVEDMQRRAREFHEHLEKRRTVREYSERFVPREIIEECLLAAGTAPSGANQQPWHFAVVADPAIKKQIREAAEEEERAFYSGRAPDEWLEALEHLGTDEHKPFLERAPYLIVIFAENHGVKPDGSKIKNYYVSESVGIATGMLIAAVHNAGLVSLTHTPSPMGFLGKVLGRPSNERAFFLRVVGYPPGDVKVTTI